jgi:RNA polymerase sigma-70 factor (ECF subfamily)
MPHLRVLAGGSADAPPPLSDDELIDAFEKGDRDVADLLYDHLEGAVDATLIKVLGRRDQDHDDLVQAAFEQILVTLARRRFGRACSLKSWAICITTNVALNAIRKRRSERRFVSPDHDSNEADVASRSIDPERAAQLSALRDELGRIAPATAQVIVLHEVMGCGLAEVAVLTGLSISAAQSRLVRGREELKRRLGASRTEAQP